MLAQPVTLARISVGWLPMDQLHTSSSHLWPGKEARMVEMGLLHMK